MAWSWEHATPFERAEFVRQHARQVVNGRGFSADTLKQMFDLNEPGLDAIMRGDVWRPHYSSTQLAE